MRAHYFTQTYTGTVLTHDMAHLMTAEKEEKIVSYSRHH